MGGGAWDGVVKSVKQIRADACEHMPAPMKREKQMVGEELALLPVKRQPGRTGVGPWEGDVKRPQADYQR